MLDPGVCRELIHWLAHGFTFKSAVLKSDMANVLDSGSVILSSLFSLRYQMNLDHDYHME